VPVIDASVAVKWFVVEPDSPSAHQLLEAHAWGSTTLVAPDLIVYEVANVLLHLPTLTTGEAQRALERLYELELELITPSAEVVTTAIVTLPRKTGQFHGRVSGC
jgi:predicted nucleic acid-binding protein